MTVKKILIANRGEIALRIIRTARQLGISTVGIYAANDAGSPWINHSSEAYALGDGDVAQTYLSISKIMEIARRSGADAIHPGYGFLAENYLLAEACREQHINFIGPSPEVLKLMGDKIAAHHLVEGLGIAVPERIVSSARDIQAMGSSLDYPVLIKAAAGGGGKGMRLVQQPHELATLLMTTSNEALNYFGDDRIYLEKYFHSPRHVEVQIMGDKHGHLVHLFERECSVQRRHQKIIEEAPSTSLSEKTRGQIIQAALKIGQALRYDGAGTIEFLLDDKQNAYFLEMNPRIQVEHGITEMITGVDIVKEQISIAGGSPLSFTASDIRRNGHAIEARVFAEDPENNLLPSPGKIHYYCQPEMQDVRIESAVVAGSVITPDYDPLIAKVLVHAPSREMAIQKLSRALGDFVITGLQHNLTLLQAILRDKDFLRNDISTTFLNDKLPSFARGIALQRKKTDSIPLAIASSIIILSGRSSSSSKSPWQWQNHWRIVPRIRFRIGAEMVELDYYPAGPDSMEFYHQEKRYFVSNIKAGIDQIGFTANDLDYRFYPLPEKDGVIELSDGSLSHRIERLHRLKSNAGTKEPDGKIAGDGIIRAPLPGKVIRLQVAENELIEQGDHLLVIESMKLENVILAPFSGIVQQINTREGDFVLKNEALLMIEQKNNKPNIHNAE